MADEKNWQSVMNIVLPQSSTAQQDRALLWALKAALKGDSGLSAYLPGGQSIATQGLHTCYYSCDGVTAGVAGDGVDRWGASSFTQANIVRNAAGAHSWFVGRTPANFGGSGQQFYWIFDYSTSNDYQATFVVCKTAPTGGTTSARPTSVDEWVQTSQQFAETALQSSHHHFLLSTDGMLWWASSRDNTGVFGALGFALQSLAEVSASDLYNCHLYMYYSQGNSCFQRAGLQSTNAWNGRDANGDSVQNTICGFSNVGGTFCVDKAVHRRSDGKVGGDRPIYMTCITAGHEDDRGRLFDAREAKTGLNDGEADPSLSNPTSIKIGNLWLPFKSVPIL